MEFKESPQEQPEQPSKKESAEKIIRPSPEAFRLWKEETDYLERPNDLLSNYPNLSQENAEDLHKKISKHSAEPERIIRSRNYFFREGSKESKVNQELSDLLYWKFLVEAKTRVEVFGNFKQEVGEDSKQFDLSMTDRTEQFRQSFKLFFKPLLQQKEIEQELNKLSETKKTLGMEHEKIGKAVHMDKSQKKEAQAELQKQILEIKKQLEPLEQQNKDSHTLVQFIPNYQREFERVKKLSKENPDPYQINQKVADNFLNSLIEKRLSKSL